MAGVMLSEAAVLDSCEVGAPNDDEVQVVRAIYKGYSGSTLVYARVQFEQPAGVPIDWASSLVTDALDVVLLAQGYSQHV